MGELHIALPPHCLPPVHDPYANPPNPILKLYLECQPNPCLCKLRGIRCDDEALRTFQAIRARVDEQAPPDAPRPGPAAGHPLAGMDIDTLAERAVDGVQMEGVQYLQYHHSFAQGLLPSSPELCAEFSDVEMDSDESGSPPENATLHQRIQRPSPDLFGLGELRFLSQEQLAYELDALVSLRSR